MNQKGFSAILILVGVLIVVGSALGLYFFSKARNTQTQNLPLNSNTPKNQIPAKEQIIYSKQIDSQKHTVFKSDLNGDNKVPIFTIESPDKGYLPDSVFSVLKNRNLVLVGLGSSLEAYNLSTSQKQTLFAGEKGKDRIFGYAVSHDGKKVALNVSNGEQSNFNSYKIIVINLDSDSQEVIISKPIVKTDIYGSSSLLPNYWSSDDRKIYLSQLENEFTSSLWVMNEDGSGLKKLSLPLWCSPSNNHQWLACTDSAKSGSKLDSGGISPGYTLKLYDLVAEKFMTISDAEDKRYGIVRWSPDSQQFLFTEERYKQGQTGSAEFYLPEAYIYDISSGKSQKAPSESEQIKKWYPGEIKAEVKGGEDEREDIRKLVIGGKVIDSTQSPSSNNPDYQETEEETEDYQETYNITFISQL